MSTPWNGTSSSGEKNVKFLELSHPLARSFSHVSQTISENGQESFVVGRSTAQLNKVLSIVRRI